MKPGRFLRVALCLFSAFLITALPAKADTNPDNSYQSAVWVAETDGVLKLAASDGSVLFEIGSSESIDALALDEKRGLLWTYGSGILSAYTFDGALNSQHQYKTSQSKAAKTLLKVSSTDGSVWLVSDNTLFHYTSTDGLLSSLSHNGITGVSVSPQSAAVWVSDNQAVYQVNEANNSLQLNSVFDGGSSIQTIQYDEYLQELWIATSSKLLRIDQSGRVVANVSLSRLELLASDIRGGLWAGVEHRVYRIDASGLIEIDLTLPQPRGGGQVTAMAADMSDGTLWVANRKSIIHLGRSGEVLQEIQQGKSNAGIRALAVYHDIIPPELTITTPENGAYINSNTPTIELEYSDIGMGVDGESLQWFVDGDEAAAECDADEEGASCTLVEPLNEGYRTLAAQVRDYADNVSEKTSMTFTVDTIPPEITVSSPGNGFYTNQSALTITGAVNEPATLTINGETAPLGLENEFSYGATLIEGLNTYTLIATDLAGNATTMRITGDLDTTPPLPAVSDLITVTIDEDQGTVAGAAGSVEPGAWVTVTNATTGESVTVKANADGSFSAGLPISPGDNLIIKVSDRAGNNADTEVTITTGTPESGTGHVPPDPVSIAPPTDPTVLTTVYNATAFLYSGDNPIQFGVAQGTIEERRVAVLRGKVTTRGGAPLSGVTITVKGRDEFGWTGTREDGAFDLVTNGGGILNVNYRKKGYLPVQRQIDAPWQDYVWLPDVVMIPLDDKVTTIDLASDIPMQVAQGSPVTDEDGTRQATILFPQGTQAEMVLPDGARQPLTTLNVRATEYTVGDEGPNTMPGVLPPTSGYTYAVELSVDEAIENGAKEVRFNQPVPLYVDNFVGFPVGEIVPVGWYDYDKAAWVPSQNGRVVKILSITNGLAELDLDGSGDTAGPEELSSLGITNAERRRLAELYSPGASLWRSPITHFTPWDCNWPLGPPDDAVEPPDDRPEKEDQDNPKDPNTCPGCIIEAENQVLGETIPVTGTPYTLNYRSDRARGYSVGRTVNIPISDSTVPASLKRIDLTVTVAGQKYNYSFPANSGQKTTFVWNGKDGMGRPVYGRVKLRYTLSFVYPGVFYSSSQFYQAFARFGDATISGARGRTEIAFTQSHSVMLDGVSATVDDVGHWSLNVHHHGSTDSTLYRGDGSRINAPTALPVFTTAVGPGISSSSYGPSYPRAVAIGPDGSIYHSGSSYGVHRVTPDGDYSLFNGASASDIAIAPDGSVYLLYSRSKTVYRRGPNGVTYTKIAGGGQCCTIEDNIPATEAWLKQPSGIAVGPDGSVYIADSSANLIRKVGPDGIISTVAGTEYTVEWYTRDRYKGNGGKATDAWLYGPKDVAVGPDGTLYIADSGNRAIRKVTPDGIIHGVARSSHAIHSLAVAKDSSVYFSEFDYFQGGGGYHWVYGNRVKRVNPDGSVEVVAGNGDTTQNTSSWDYTWTTAFTGEGESPVAASIDSPFGVALGPDGALYIAASKNKRILKVSPKAKAVQEGRFLIPSTDNNDYYLFDVRGRHQETVDSISGAQKYAFSYNSEGRLAGLTDTGGNTTVIEYDGSANPVAMVSPDGQRTEFLLDANGYLAAVTNPAGETYRTRHLSNGLLVSVTKPTNATSTYRYDAKGRLVSDQDPVGGGWTIGNTKTDNGFSSFMSSAEGRTSRFSVERLSPTEVKRTTESPDGVISSRRIKTGISIISEETVSADGTVTTRRKSPDPRVGMDAPYVNATTVTTPAGLELSATASRSSTLEDPEDPLSLTALSESMTTNGRSTTTDFNADTRTWTRTSALGRQRIVKVNDRGHPVLSQIAGLNATGYAYDNRGRLTAVTEGEGNEARTTTFGYDAQGNVERITDAQDRSVFFNYDRAGRVTAQTLPDGRVIRYSYDANGNLTSLVPPGREAHAFDYTPVDLEEQYTPPNLDGVQTKTHYSYNLDKQLTEVRRPDGQAVSLAYNNGGKLDTLTIPRGQYSYGYNPTSGQLDTITTPDGGSLSFSYDGFLPRSITWNGEVSGSVSQSYDNNFWVTARNVNGMHVSYSYDKDGLLTQAGELVLSRSPENGLLTATTLGNTDSSRSHNRFGELASETAQTNGTAVLSTHYERDKLGRITHKVETIDGVTTTYDYGYDRAGRLETVKENGATVSIYSYDDNGNRLGHNDRGTVTSAGYDEQDRLQSYGNATYVYTENGELIAKSEGGVTTTYDYDVLGNLMQVTLPGDMTIDYVIDGKNRRIGKKVNGVLTQGLLYKDQLNPVAELDGSGNVVSRFVYGEKANVPSYMVKEGITYRIFSDHLGSPRLVINTSSGEVAQRMDYDEFGNIINDTNPGFQPFGFAGGIYDLYTGLVRFGGRDYDARTGRWTAKDPIRFNGGQANLFAYVVNNPVNFTDPLGLRWETVGIDYHGMKNWGMGIANRLANLEEGTIASPKNCVGCTRDIIQEWIPHPDDPQNNRNSCTADDPAPGDRRKIEQQFGEFPDPWNVNGKSWHWEPPVPSPTYQNSFEGMYY